MINYTIYIYKVFIQYPFLTNLVYEVILQLLYIIGHLSYYLISHFHVVNFSFLLIYFQIYIIIKIHEVNYMSFTC